MNKAQQKSLLRVWQRDNSRMTFLQFRRSVEPQIGYANCFMVQSRGMWLGIEEDGYTHS
jgi:hypothetical protein